MPLHATVSKDGGEFGARHHPSRRVSAGKGRLKRSSATVLVVKRAAIFCCLGAWR